ETFYWTAHFAAAPNLNYAQGVPPEHSTWGVLGGDDAGFRALLERLRREPSLHALVVASFTVTHSPYDTTHVQQFRDAYPEEAAGVSLADQERYTSLYKANVFPLSYDFPGTMQRLGLSESEQAQLVRTVELLYRSNIAHLDALFGSIVDAIDQAG